MDSQEYQIFSSTMCRTCLQKEEHLMPIHHSKAAKMLHYCNFCKVSDDDLPNQICLSCLQMLEQCYTFKKLCAKSEATLKKAAKRSFKLSDQGSVKNNSCQNRVKEDEALSIEYSVDSSDMREDLSKTNTKTLTDANNKVDEQDISESPCSIREDLTSFLEQPLPPPLPYRCQKCDHSFNEEKDLNIHQSVHNPDLICLACSKKFTGRQTLKRHLKIHLVQKPHVCKICGKSFAESYALVKHLRHHSGIPREKKHFCDECGQGFSEPYYLKLHMRKHTGERPFVCSTCQKSFSDPRSLKTHSMIHTGDRPYECHYCWKSFIQNTNLTKHLRVHTGEKPYTCKVCDKKFSQSCSLEKHLKLHIGDKVYGCDKCNERYSDKTALKNHNCKSLVER